MKWICDSILKIGHYIDKIGQFLIFPLTTMIFMTKNRFSFLPIPPIFLILLTKSGISAYFSGLKNSITFLLKKLQVVTGLTRC